jgi:hypothetical protein
LAQFAVLMGWKIFVRTPKIGNKNKKYKYFSIENSKILEIANLPLGAYPIKIGDQETYPMITLSTSLKSSQIITAIAKGLVLPYMKVDLMHIEHEPFHNFSITRTLKQTLFCFIDLHYIQRKRYFIFTNIEEVPIRIHFGIEILNGSYHLYGAYEGNLTNIDLKISDSLPFVEAFFALTNAALSDVEHKMILFMLGFMPTFDSY